MILMNHLAINDIFSSILNFGRSVVCFFYTKLQFFDTKLSFGKISSRLTCFGAVLDKLQCYPDSADSIFSIISRGFFKNVILNGHEVKLYLYTILFKQSFKLGLVLMYTTYCGLVASPNQIVLIASAVWNGQISIQLKIYENNIDHLFFVKTYQLSRHLKTIRDFKKKIRFHFGKCFYTAIETLPGHRNEASK